MSSQVCETLLLFGCIEMVINSEEHTGLVTWGIDMANNKNIYTKRKERESINVVCTIVERLEQSDKEGEDVSGEDTDIEWDTLLGLIVKRSTWHINLTFEVDCMCV